MEDTSAVALVREAADAFNRGDADGYLGFFHPDGSRWVVGFDVPLTLNEIRQNVGAMFAGFDQLELTAEALFGQGDTVCARWRLRGVHVGDFLGLSASGRAIDVRTCEVYEIQENRVRDVWTYGDHLELIRQIEPMTVGGNTP